MAARIAANKAKMLSLGLPDLALKVGGRVDRSRSSFNSNSNSDPDYTAVGGSGPRSGAGARAPGSFAPVKRKKPEPAEKPRPFRIVLRQRVAKANYADLEGEEEEDDQAKKKARKKEKEKKKARNNYPRLTTPSTYSALGVRRPTFQVPTRRPASAGAGAGAPSGTPTLESSDAAAAEAPAPPPPPQFQSLDDKYTADHQAAQWAMTMGVRIGSTDARTRIHSKSTRLFIYVLSLSLCSQTRLQLFSSRCPGGAYDAFSSERVLFFLIDYLASSLSPSCARRTCPPTHSCVF